MKPIGVLGGMGPRATVYFEQLLLDMFPGTDQDVPLIITINDGGIPDRTDFLVNSGDDPLPRMQRNLTMLEELGASIVCVPCNTACTPRIFNRLVTRGSLLINLPAEVIDFATSLGLKRLLLLATEGTIASKAYQDLCASQQIECNTLDGLTQGQVNQVIKLVKSGDINMASELAVKINKTLSRMPADAVILGCTELSRVGDVITPQEFTKIDTLSVLARTCLERSRLS